MAEPFDPYRKWLGIPPAEQPPDHYRLLGIGRFEDDPDTISNAADRQMAHVRTFQTGPRSAISQKLLNEISAARVCLLNLTKKADYDRDLRAVVEQPPTASPSPAVDVLKPAVVERPLATPPARTEGFRNPAVGERPPTTPPASTERLLNATSPGHRPIPVSGFAVAPPEVVKQRRPSHTPWKPTKKSPILPVAIAGGCLLAVAAVVLALRGGARSLQPLADQPQSADQPIRGEAIDQAAPALAGAESSHEAAGLVPQPKLEIIEAEWGEGDRWQDITARMRSLVFSERLVATASGDLFRGVPDPAFGAAKQVRIRYRAAGEPHEAEFADGDLIDLDGRPAGSTTTSSAGLEVVEALYGSGTAWIDVLPRLRRWLHGNRLAVRVEAASPADPAPGQRKTLVLHYRTPEGEFTSHAWDSEVLAIDARPLDTAGKPMVPAAARKVVDLLKLIDPKLDAIAGDWQWTDEGLLSPSGEAMRLGVPYSPPDDYELRMIAARRSGNDGFFLGLLVDGRPAMLALDRFGGTSSGLHLLDGEPTDRNATNRQGTVFSDERPKQIICTVRPSSVRVTCDDRLLVDWHGDARRLSIDPRVAMPDELGLAVSAWNTNYLISKLELRPLPPEPPTVPADLSQPVDVLKQVDLAHDAVYGDWRKDGAALVPPATPWGRLQLPVIPPAEYTLSIEALGDRDLVLGIVVGGRQVEVVLDGWSGDTSGMQNVGGQGADRNPTTHHGQVLRDDGPNTIVCTVREDNVEVVCNGTPVISWRGDPQSLSLPHEAMMPDDRRPFLRSWSEAYRITRLTLLAPDAAPAPAVPTPTKKQRSLADLLDQPSAEADSRLPVPSGDELTAAEQKVEATFAPQWKTAKKVADRLALARKIYETGLQTTDTPAQRYALLREASQRAAALGDAATACEAVEHLGREYQTDALLEKLSVAGAALQKVRQPAQAATIAMFSLLLTDRALDEERMDEARKLASLAASAARRARNQELAGAAERRQVSVRRRQEQHAAFEEARSRLREQPDDAEANRAAGLYLCVVRGQWSRGLPLLSRSQDGRLTEIAQLETGAGKDPRQRAALADAWLAMAQSQPVTLRTECELQAKYWYDRGLPSEALTVDRLTSKAALEKQSASSISQARLASGLDMAIFDGADFQQFRSRRVDRQICANFGFGSPDPSVPGDNFSLRWTGWIRPPAPGKYVVRANADDSVRVRIAGKLVIDRWGQGAGDQTNEIDLTDELQPFVVEYNDYQVTADICLRWALKDVSDLHIVPPEAFYYDPAMVP